MKLAWFMILGSPFLFSGCSHVTDADPGDLEFSWQPAQGSEPLADSEPEVSVGDGTLTVSGALSAPDPCQRLTGQLDGSGSRLVLLISVVSDLSEDEVCVTSIGGFQYTAVVGGLEARTYELRVLLEYPRTGWSTRTVLEREIAVR